MFFSQPLHFVTHALTNLIPLMPYTPSLGSNGPYNSVLGIHFTTRVAPTTVRRKHNNGVPKFRVNTDGETENTTPLPPTRKECFCFQRCVPSPLHGIRATLFWPVVVVLCSLSLRLCLPKTLVLHYCVPFLPSLAPP